MVEELLIQGDINNTNLELLFVNINTGLVKYNKCECSKEKSNQHFEKETSFGLVTWVPVHTNDFKRCGAAGVEHGFIEDDPT